MGRKGKEGRYILTLFSPLLYSIGHANYATFICIRFEIVFEKYAYPPAFSILKLYLR
jgi:hypothetical protein